MLLSSIHRNFHLRWSHSSNPPSGPEHLEGVSCKTQLRFIYHLNPHRLLTLPAGSTLTALVVWCEKSGLTPIKQQSCPTDSSTHFLLVDLWAEKHGRKEIITDLLLFFNLQLLLLQQLQIKHRKRKRCSYSNSPLLRLVSLTSSWTWSQEVNWVMKWHTKTKAAFHRGIKSNDSNEGGLKTSWTAVQFHWTSLGGDFEQANNKLNSTFFFLIFSSLLW